MSNLRKRLLCTRSCNTPSKPASAYRRLIRYTVPSATSKAAANRGAFQPSSILNRMQDAGSGHDARRVFTATDQPVQALSFFLGQLYCVSFPSQGCCTCPQPNVAVSVAA